jgi:hypothetical protein
VLSAGHCVHGGGGRAIPAESMTVYVGSANLSEATPIQVERIILRSEYIDKIDEQVNRTFLFTDSHKIEMIKILVKIQKNFEEILSKDENCECRLGQYLIDRVTGLLCKNCGYSRANRKDP